MPAPTLQAQGNIAAVTTGNLAITLPAYAANDIVVITTMGWVPNTTTGTNTQSLASPWTKNSPNVTTITGGIIDAEYACWWARATSASSLGTTVTITRPTSWDTGNDTCWAGRAYVIRGCVETGNPFDEFASTAISTAANPALPAITVNGGNRLAIVFMAKADNTATPTAATGYTVGTEASTTTGTDGAFQSYSQTASANISTVTPTGGVAPAQGGSVYFEFSFAPAPVTATAAAPLGGITGSATATVKRAASGAAPLGGITSTASATVKHPATLAAPLGDLTGSATATVSKLITATATAPLGGLNGSASATVSHQATATSTLGGITATATATVIAVIEAAADAPLGTISSNATASIIDYATADAPLGTVTATASASVAHFVTAADAPLGDLFAEAIAGSGQGAIATADLHGMVAHADATVWHTTDAQAPLGGLTATAHADPGEGATATAPLGALNATAIAHKHIEATASAPLGGIVAHAGAPEPQPPTPAGRPPRRIYPEPKPKPKFTLPPLQRPPAFVIGKARTIIPRLEVTATADITWSREDDDLEVLLMV